jgi:predicted outer membrane repeat protein
MGGALMLLVNTTVRGCAFDGNTARRGGAVAADGAIVRLLPPMF